MSIFEKYWEKFVKPMDDKRIPTLRVPRVIEQNNIAYANSEHRLQLLDVYSPVDAQGLMPTIVDIHGGGWYYGDKDLNKIYCLNLAERGMRVVNISYRLTPEVDLKNQVKDIFCALNFIYDNAENYGIDINNLFLTGDSAGAHLASMVANVLDDPSAQEAFGVSSKIRFNAIAYTCAAFNIARLATTPIVKSYFKPILGKANNNPLLPYVAYRPNLGSTPSLFITCDGDFMKNQTITGYEEYKSFGNDAELIYFDKASQTNKLAHVYNITQTDWPEAIETNDKTIAFFRKYIVK